QALSTAPCALRMANARQQTVTRLTSVEILTVPTCAAPAVRVFSPWQGRCSWQSPNASAALPAHALGSWPLPLLHDADFPDADERQRATTAPRPCSPRFEALAVRADVRRSSEHRSMGEPVASGPAAAQTHRVAPGGRPRATPGRRRRAPREPGHH